MIKENMGYLRISEIFHSIQGETSLVGQPTGFIRLTGCPLRCNYCDTEYAFTGGTQKSIKEILSIVADYQIKFVTVTGGEPLAQQNCLILLKMLCDLGYTVSLETSGAIDISNVDKRVIRIVDVKTPGSSECDKNRLENLQYLTNRDQLKFVLVDNEDYVWAIDFIKEHNLNDKCEILFSASYKQLPDQTLADWIIKDKLQVRFQMQIHKYLWDDQPGK